MARRPRDIGTDAERAVVRVLRASGWPHAERRALRGGADAGDITGTPGIVWEVKGGNAARRAGDRQVYAWTLETDRERRNAGADIGVLVMQRAGVGPANAHRWWAVIPAGSLARLLQGEQAQVDGLHIPVRMILGDLLGVLRAAGYGEPLPAAPAAGAPGLAATCAPEVVA